MAARRKPQLPLPGIEPGSEPIEIEIPTMEWAQIGGDQDPGTYGGTIATGDGHALELLKIQPVREYVGDKEAADVGFPFWTREAIEEAAKSLDWWKDEIPGSSSGHTYVWAKRKEGAETEEARRRSRSRTRRS